MASFLVLGSGGREHALAWRLAHSGKHQVFVAPGNAGMAPIAQLVNLQTSDFEALAKFAKANRIDTIIVGPEQPLVDGIADYFAQNHPDLALLGPDKACAQLEGSKAFSKAFMARHNIPTAAYKEFGKTELEACRHYILQQPLPIVIKADGLAAGKGVIIAETHEEALQAVEEMLTGAAFGAAGEVVVIEQFLKGRELSYFVLADGNGHYVTLPQAKDYKRIGDGDTGLNTGGMGTISPVPFATPELLEQVDQLIVQPTLNGLAAEGLHYRGFLFIGLMEVDGKAYVIEYNCRLGDPETQSLMMRLPDEFATVCQAAAKGELTQAHATLTLSAEPVCTVVLSSGGYPGNFQKGYVISGLEEATLTAQHKLAIFHAGTAKNQDGLLVNNGGRVLAVTAQAPTWALAIETAQKAAGIITWEGRYYRKDIGKW